jgi:hypothetical protein
LQSETDGSGSSKSGIKKLVDFVINQNQVDFRSLKTVFQILDSVKKFIVEDDWQEIGERLADGVNSFFALRDDKVSDTSQSRN